MNCFYGLIFVVESGGGNPDYDTIIDMSSYEWFSMI